MIRFAVLLVVTAATASAQAAIDLDIDTPYRTAIKPASGTIDVVFGGTIDLLLPTFDVTGATIEFPQRIPSGSLLADFHPDFLAYLGSASPGVDYSGNLFTVTVADTSAEGDYFFDATNGLAEFTVGASDGNVTGEDGEFYGVTVVPEPATIAALGFGAAALLPKRRRESKSQ